MELRIDEHGYNFVKLVMQKKRLILKIKTFIYMITHEKTARLANNCIHRFLNLFYGNFYVQVGSYSLQPSGARVSFF